MAMRSFTAVLAACALSGCTAPVFFSAGHSPDALPGSAGGERQPWSSSDDSAAGNWPAMDPWGATLGSQTAGPGAPEEAWGERPAVSFDSGARAVPPGSTGAGGFGMRGNSGVEPTEGPPTAARFGADGGAAVAEIPGTIGVLDAPARSLEADSGGRTYILEIVQDMREERDALREENDSLLAELGSLQQQLATATSSAPADAQLAERNAQLQRDLEAKQGEVRDMAARLLQAQVRRLESDQRLIEQWIALEGGTVQPASAVVEGP